MALAVSSVTGLCVCVCVCVCGGGGGGGIELVIGFQIDLAIAMPLGGTHTCCVSKLNGARAKVPHR